MFGFIYIKENSFHHRGFFYHKIISINEIEQIKYHYCAAVGPMEAEWEFILISNESYKFSYLNFGINKMLKKFEKFFPGFSKQKFKNEFNDGDVTDTLELWP